MLQKIREKTSGWIAGIILGLIIFAMAFFGIESYFAARIDTYAAKIEAPPTWWKGAPDNSLIKRFFWTKDEVSADQFRQRFDQYRQQVRQSMGDNYDADQVETLETKREVLDRLIDERVVALSADRQGIRASSEQVKEAIMDIDGLTVDGKFVGQDQYLIWLQSRQMTAPQLEKMVADDIVSRTVAGTITDTALADRDALREFLKLQRQTRNIVHLPIPPAKPSDVAPTEAAINTYYDKNASKFRSEETATIAYLEVDASKLPEPAAASEADLKRRYEEGGSRFGSEEERRISHILIRAAKDADEKTVAEAKQRADDAAAKARVDGADFAQLAQTLSDDEGSKSSGGDLGVIEKDVFPKPFEEAAMALTEGGVSDPVRTDEGWHVLKLTSLSAAQKKSFDEVREELAKEYVDAERERVFADLSGKLVDQLLKDPSSLEKTATALKLSIKKEGPFTRDTGSGVAGLAQVRKAAFDDAQINDRQVSDPVDLGPNHIVVLQVTEHQPAQAQPLDKVRDQVITAVKAQAQVDANKAQADAIFTRVQKGETLEAIAKSLEVEVITTNEVIRQASVPDSAIVEKAFGLLMPEKGSSSAPTLVKTSDGNYALLSLTKINDADMAQFDDATLDALATQWTQLRGTAEARAYLESLRKTFSITVAEDRL